MAHRQEAPSGFSFLRRGMNTAHLLVFWGRKWDWAIVLTPCGRGAEVFIFASFSGVNFNVALSLEIAWNVSKGLSRQFSSGVVRGGLHAVQGDAAVGFGGAADACRAAAGATYG